MPLAGSYRQTRRIIVAVTGASGVAIGVRALQLLHSQPQIETHFIISPAGILTLKEETGFELADVRAMATHTHKIGAIGDSIASGSYPVDGMLVAPCSVKTLSAIANSYSDNLITRAADVTMKEGRPLILVVRETPLHIGHLRLMTSAAEAGAVIMPPVPAFYPKPDSVDQIVDHIARRALSRMGVSELDSAPWLGVQTVDRSPQSRDCGQETEDIKLSDLDLPRHS
jgi:4-hydroxy-3-polyprenylbenzoate decarboxylase